MRTRISSIVLATAILAATTGALGQVRQIQLGNPLDANPGVNSGGANNPIPGFVPINGNDVITGNVGGLGYFHGNTNISNPYEFHGNLPSSGLYNFARQSAPQAPNGQARPYFLPSATVATGQGSLYSAPIGSGFDSRVVPVFAFNPNATSAQLNGLNGAVTGQAYNRVPPPSFSQPLDSSVQGGVLNNPLFMLRTTEALERQRVEAAARQAATQPATRPGLETQPDSPLMVPDQLNTNINTQVATQSPEIKAARATDNRIDDRVGSVYAGLAVDLMKAKGPDSEKPGVGRLVKTNEIDPLTGRARLTAMAATGPSNAGAAATKPADAQGLIGMGISAKPLEDVTKAQLTAGARVAPLSMTAPAKPGITPTAFDVVMARAETAMKEGKYSDAQFAYQTALANKPDDPLALVGLAHAELASGAYASAANDLKFIFARKPELVSLRYKAGSFIPQERQEFLLEDLQKETASKDSGDMASFLYCYICYQTGRTTALETELKKWIDHPSHDTWADVLQRAWVK